MIVELSVENVAIIERATLSLGPGFTVVTGETGAGKSLLVDAIELALGARADADLVRSGASRALVALTVDVSENSELANRCMELGFEPEDGCLFVQRELFAEGRSQARVQGRMAPISALKALGSALADLHGQHEHQSLLVVERHLDALDAWIGPDAAALRTQVAQAFEQKVDAERRFRAMRTGRREREQRLDLLLHQVSEIEALMPAVGEMETLEARMSRLKNVAALSEATAFALQSLERAEGSAAEAIGRSLREIESAAKLDATLDAVLGPLRGALYSLEEAVDTLRAYESGLESDPAQLEQTAERIEALRRLRRKYGDDEGAVLRYLALAREELATLEGSSESEHTLLAALEEADRTLAARCMELSHLRRAGCAAFAEQVGAQLRGLEMRSARFEVRLEPKDPDPSGADAVEFLFSANPGEPPRPLAKIASGGEVSRLMLALKCVLAGRAGVPTLIFDELESGLGGSAAAAVAKKLEEIARHYQVVVISHLPQIASRASSHVRIEKVEENGRTITRLRTLDREGRVQEIARMLAGESVGESAVANARELLGMRPGACTG